MLNAGTPHTLVATGCDDGSVRVWRGVFQEQSSPSSPQETTPSLLTAFQASTDVNPATRSKMNFPFSIISTVTAVFFTLNYLNTLN